MKWNITIVIYNIKVALNNKFIQINIIKKILYVYFLSDILGR